PHQRSGREGKIRAHSPTSSFGTGASPLESDPKMSTSEHHALAAQRGPVTLALVTVSDTRTPETAVNGTYLRGVIEEAGHRVASYDLVRDEPVEVVAALDRIAAAGDARIAIFNGGTGISRRDTTYDALSARLEKTLPGFGEIFRMLSYEQVG